MKELRQHIRLIPVGQSVTDPFDLMSDNILSAILPYLTLSTN